MSPTEKVEKSDEAVRSEADHRSLARLHRIENPAQRAIDSGVPFFIQQLFLKQSFLLSQNLLPSIQVNKFVSRYVLV